MVFIASTYLFNLMCAIVPCQATMKPPEASIIETFSDTESASSNVNYIVNSSSVQNRPKRVQNTHLENDLFLGRHPNLMHPLRTLTDAFRKGVEQSEGYINNFGNHLFPFPDLSEGTIKRNVRPHSSVGKLNETVVYLKNGDAVQGYYVGTMKGHRIIAFQGIPYAEPPTGKLRFRPPVPKRPWHGILKATRTGSECIQGHPINVFRITGSENCLFLNIYTNQTSSSPKRGALQPVIFFIHGGSFMYGSGSEYGHAYMMDQGVVLVTFNYRLGALGFLTTQDSHSPGNYGLKDQAMALKWVHDNIEQFGGDSKRITIMGQSAGGVSAHIHLLANKTTHLFQNGVSLSGSAFGFWPVVQKQRALGFTKRLATYLRCPLDDSAKLMQCLRVIRPNFIIAAQLHFFKWIPFHPLIVFAPVVEPDVPTAYFTQAPEEIYAAGAVAKKPWIFGQTSQEGHFEIYMINLFFQTPILSARFKDLLPVVLDYEEFTKEPQRSELTKKIMNFYRADTFGIDNDPSLITNAVSEMYTDRLFTNGIQKAIRYQSLVAPTYAYVFDYMGKYNLGAAFGAARSEWGVVHTEDLFYFFNSSVFHDGFKRNDPEYKLSEIMTNLIANYATFGEPLHTNENGTTIKIWDEAVSRNKVENITALLKGSEGVDKLPIHYLRLKQVIEMMEDPFLERNQFWKSLGMKL